MLIFYEIQIHMSHTRTDSLFQSKIILKKNILYIISNFLFEIYFIISVTF
jgi:hypothetical protein